MRMWSMLSWCCLISSMALNALWAACMIQIYSILWENKTHTPGHTWIHLFCIVLCEGTLRLRLDRHHHIVRTLYWLPRVKETSRGTIWPALFNAYHHIHSLCQHSVYQCKWAVCNTVVCFVSVHLQTLLGSTGHLYPWHCASYACCELYSCLSVCH